jgi:deoxyribonuclease-4
VDLSVHAPYYVNLATDDEEKLLQCKQRIMESCRIAHILDAKRVVFHPGYYQDKSQKTASNIIQNQILLLMEQIEKENLNIILCPETTGRKSEFGHIEELLKIQDQTGCGICIDFSHILARSGGSIRFKEMVEMIPKREHLHCHYSGIRWTDKGEAGHEPMEKEQFQELASAIISSKKFKTVTIICEAPPDTKTGSVLMQKWLKEI